MTNQELSDTMYKVMMEIIADEDGYDTFEKRKVIERRGIPAFANVDGTMYVTATFVNHFISIEPETFESYWYQDHYIDAFKTTETSVIFKKHRRLYDLSSRPVYMLNKQGVKDYFGVV